MRDPDEFIAGGLHTNPNAWESILRHHPLAQEILGWICHRVDILHFSQPFSGSYKVVHSRSDWLLARRFVNPASCKRFPEFVSLEIKKRLITGAVRVLGKVGVSAPPHVVLPLTVEPTKPRLCIEARFVNLWMKDSPFALDRLSDVPRFVYKGSFMTKCDDKSGYVCTYFGFVCTYFGFEWGGLWFVCTTLPFGWKMSPYV